MNSKDNISILKKIANKSGQKIYQILDIADEVNLYNKKIGFIDKPNSVYLPKIGNSQAVNLLSDLKIKPHNYFQIVLKDKFNPNYLAQFFSTDLGMKWRRSLETGIIPKINKRNLLNSEIFLPHLKIQNDVLAADSVIRDVLTELNIEKRNLWRNPQNAEKIREKYKNMRFTNENWINSLPFPLASILWAYDSELIGMVKFKYLLRFFEAFSQFNFALLLSAIKGDKNFYNKYFKKCMDNMDNMDNNWLSRPDFGNWNSLGMCFSKQIRSLLETTDGSSETVHSLFRNPNNHFLKIITNKKLYKVLETAREYRNVWDAHDTPAIPPEECNRRTKLLFDLVLNLKELTSDLYDTILFFLPISGGCKKGDCYYRIRKLKGPNAHLKKDEIDISPSAGILDEDDIYFINEDQIEPIKLVKLIKIMKSPQQEPNACYFYNRMDGKEARLITYHFKNKHEELVEFNLNDIFS